MPDGVYGGMGLVRFLALPWVGASRLLQYPLGKCSPDRALSLLLHQACKAQVFGENVGLCTRVTDEAEHGGGGGKVIMTVEKGEGTPTYLT